MKNATEIVGGIALNLRRLVLGGVDSMKDLLATHEHVRTFICYSSFIGLKKLGVMSSISLLYISLIFFSSFIEV